MVPWNRPRDNLRSMRIRLAEASDGPRVAEIYRPAVVSFATSFEVDPPDGSEMARRIGAVTQRTPWLVGEEDGAVLGYAYAGTHRERAAYSWSVEVSAYVDPSALRSGLGRRLYERLFAILTLQGFQNAYAGITLPNPASVGFHEALGFSMVGTYRRIGYKNGAWHDVRWYERSLGTHAPNPSPPRPLPEVAREPSFANALAAVRSEQG